MELLMDIWNTISPFVFGYLVFVTILAVLFLAFVSFVVVQLVKGYKEFKAMEDRKKK